MGPAVGGPVGRDAALPQAACLAHTPPAPRCASISLPRPLIQVLAKSSKMIPVMLMGSILHGKRYSALEYACCLAISAGVGLFGMKSSHKVTGRSA